MTTNCPLCGRDWLCRPRAARCPTCFASSRAPVATALGWLLMGLALAADVAVLALAAG
jgi:hypothetical protein